MRKCKKKKIANIHECKMEFALTSIEESKILDEAAISFIHDSWHNEDCEFYVMRDPKEDCDVAIILYTKAPATRRSGFLILTIPKKFDENNERVAPIMLEFFGINPEEEAIKDKVCIYGKNIEAILFNGFFYHEKLLKDPKAPIVVKAFRLMHFTNEEDKDREYNGCYLVKNIIQRADSKIQYRSENLFKYKREAVL